MSLLHIYDSSDWRIRQTASARGAVHKLPIADGDNLVTALDGELRAGRYYERILFETHGAPGQISFGGKAVTAAYWRAVTTRNWYRLVTNNARIYFNGCNVAEGATGWEFLETAVDVFMKPGGGEMFGQTSVGFGNPFNGHVVHLWGSTRTLFVNAKGRIIERFEQ